MAGFNSLGTQIGDLLSSANTDWTGTFGGEDFAPAILNPPSSEPRSTKNAPLNDTPSWQFPDYGETSPASWSIGNQTNFNFDATGMPILDREKQFLQNEREATLAGQRSLQQQLTGAGALSEIAASNYAKKVQADLAAQQQLDRSRQKPQGGFSAGGALSLEGGLSRAQALGDIARIRAQGEADRRLAQQQGREARLNSFANADASANLNFENAYTQDRLNRWQNQFTASENQLSRDLQQRLAQLQADTARYTAQTQAMGNVYGSMFGALSSPGANYRYWS